MSYVSGPVKLTGHKLDVYKQSATQSETIGTKWVWDTGETFRYAYARGALTAGKMCVKTAQETNITNITATTAYVAGTRQIQQTITALTYAVPENGWVGGKLIVNDETGEGHSYPIIANQAISTTDTEIRFLLGKGLIHAWVAATTDITIVPSLWGPPGATQATSPHSAPLLGLGVPLVDISAGYYCWLQTGGMCSVLHDATGATTGWKINSLVFPSLLTAGAVGTSMYGYVSTSGYSPVGVEISASGISTEYNPIYLTID